MPRLGEQELASAQSLTQSTKRYRYNETALPNLNSKSFARKVSNMEAKWRKEGLKGDAMKDAKKQWLETKIGKPEPQGKSELKTKHEIVKQRVEKEKRREKTGRHTVGKKRKQ